MELADMADATSANKVSVLFTDPRLRIVMGMARGVADRMVERYADDASAASMGSFITAFFTAIHIGVRYPSSAQSMAQVFEQWAGEQEGSSPEIQAKAVRDMLKIFELAIKQEREMHQ